MQNKRAQAWGFDLTLSIFLVVVGMVAAYIYAYNILQREDSKFNNLKRDAEKVANLLVSEGYPINWSYPNVIKIGLTTSGKIDERKIKEFYDMSISDYQVTKNILGIRANYFVNFTEPITISDTSIEIVGIGLEPFNEEQIVKVSRFVVYKGKTATMRVILWE